MSFLYLADFLTFDAAVAAAVAQRRKLIIPPGTHRPTVQVVISQNVRLMIESSGCPWDTIIDYTALAKPWIVTDRSVKYLEFSNIKFMGIGEVFRQYCTAAIPPSTVIPNNTGGFWTTKVSNCVFNVAGTAWSQQTPDSPHALFEYCQFLGSGENARAIVWRGNPTNFVVKHCVFGNHVYGITLGCDGGGYFRWMDNEFFNFAPRPPLNTAHYWILPGTERGGDGRGGRIRANKHGNEYSTAQDCIMLLADADQYDLTVAKPVAAKSAGRIFEVSLEDEQVATYSQTQPVVISYASGVTNCKFQVNRVNNTRPIIGSGKIPDSTTPGGLLNPITPDPAVPGLYVDALTPTEVAALAVQVVSI